MLSETAIEYLSPLVYREDAKRLCCLLPYSGIYWDDEVISDIGSVLKLSKSDRHLILRLFAIRMQIWHHAELSESDQEFWDCAKAQAPSYPLFRRLILSAEDRRAQDIVSKQGDEWFEALLSFADEIEISEGESGITSYSVTYDLTKLEESPDFFDSTAEQQNVILIDAATLHKAEKLIESCEHCNEEGAEIPFDNILDRVTGSDPTVTDYILERPGNCPNCQREVLEKTLVEPV
jgi:hypothetical protein